MVYEDISKPAGEGLEVQIYVSSGVKTREIIDEAPLPSHQSPQLECQMDLPILINPQSSSIRRLSKVDSNVGGASRKSIDIPVPRHINNSVASLSTSPVTKSLLAGKRNKSFPSDKNTSSTSSLATGRDSSERQLPEEQVLTEGKDMYM